jgi:hypothetical protein
MYCSITPKQATGTKHESNSEVLYGGAAEVVGRVDAGGFRALEDAVLHLRLDAVGLGGRGNPVEGGFKGETDHDAMREMRPNSSGGRDKGVGCKAPLAE